MTEYNPKSLKAEEFINDAEIRATLAYADEHKNDLELVDKIIEKAKLKKGLTHREASVLLACDDKEKIAEIYDLAEQIKKDFYGNRIVMFAPLYLSNYCVNGCLYCPYHQKNKHIARKKLTQDEVEKEVIALQDMGHKRLAIEAGEDPLNNPIEYILECIKTIYSIKHKNGAIRRVNVNIAATTVENYRKLKEAEIGKGFDALHGEYVDMVEKGIIDPAKVTRSALQNATSVASTLLTTESVVANIKEEAPAMPAGAPAGMGMM